MHGRYKLIVFEARPSWTSEATKQHSNDLFARKGSEIKVNNNFCIEVCMADELRRRSGWLDGTRVGSGLD